MWGTVLWSWPDSSSRPGTGTGSAYKGPSEHSWSALWSSTLSPLHPRWSGAGETSVVGDIYPLRPAVYRESSPPPCTGLCTISPAGQSGTKCWSCGSPRCCKAPGSAPGGRPPAPERGGYSRYPRSKSLCGRDHRNRASRSTLPPCWRASQTHATCSGEKAKEVAVTAGKECADKESIVGILRSGGEVCPTSIPVATGVSRVRSLTCPRRSVELSRGSVYFTFSFLISPATVTSLEETDIVFTLLLRFL